MEKHNNLYISQVRPWSRVFATAAAPSASERSSSRVTRRPRRRRCTTLSFPQMCTEEKCCSCTPFSVSESRLVFQWSPVNHLQLHVNVKTCQILCKCKKNPNIFMYLFILRSLTWADLHHQVCISTSYRPIHTALIIIALMGEIIHYRRVSHQAAEWHNEGQQK